MLSNSSNILASLLSKRAAQEAMPPSAAEEQHEAAETPEQEATEHLPGQYEESEVEPEESQDAEVEQMLSQLSPEQLEHLTSLLAEDMHGEDMHGGDMHGGDADNTDVNAAELAQAIQEHLASNPEANPENISPEKMAALNFVKSASYIEGFIEQAIENGSSIKEAVDIYDAALSKSIAHLNNHKSAAFTSNSVEDLSEKQAAYYEGILERAREYGFSDAETLNIVKTANAFSPQNIKLLPTANAAAVDAALAPTTAAIAKQLETAKALEKAKAIKEIAKKRQASRDPGMGALYRLARRGLYNNRGIALGLGGLATGLAGASMLSGD